MRLMSSVSVRRRLVDWMLDRLLASRDHWAYYYCTPKEWMTSH